MFNNSFSTKRASPSIICTGTKKQDFYISVAYIGGAYQNGTSL